MKILSVKAHVDRVSIKQDRQGVTAWVVLEFPPGPSDNGWVSIALTEEQANILRLRVGKAITFSLEDM